MLWIALGWVIGFTLWFYSFVLPNNPAYSRFDVWAQLPVLYLDLIDPVPLKEGPPSGWGYLIQRVPIFACGLLIHLAAFATGRLIWRVMRPPIGRDSLDGVVLAWVLGLSAWSLLTLGLGLLGHLSQVTFLLLLVAALLAEIALSAKQWRTVRDQVQALWKQDFAGWLPRTALAAAPFLMIIFAGAMLPSIDFDVKEYHLQGPKEYFLAGEISFLPHNVYTSFPFLTEMLSLLGMVVYGDWYWGALVGKCVLAGFAPLTALAVYAMTRRWFGVPAASLGLLFHLSTPWTYRISIIAYAEGGLTCFLATTALALQGVFHNVNAAETVPKFSWRGLMLVGLLAGSGMACKYPGLVSVVIPAGVVVLAVWWFGRPARSGDEPPAESSRKLDGRSLLIGVAALAVGVAISVGPWLLKNLVETGNPVYPLAYSIFGGADWDERLDAKWKAAHSPDHYHPSDILVKLMDVSAKSDWQSALLFAFAPLALWRSPRQRAIWLWLAVGYQFAVWWGLTHRLDRFWVPMIPLLAVLAAAGADALRANRLGPVVGVMTVLSVVYNFGFATTGLCGYNAYLIDLPSARVATARITSPHVLFLNEYELPPEAKVLSVGDAELFDAEFPVVYNTVFDYSIFAELTAAPEADREERNAPFRPTEEIRRALREAGITHVYVDWSEVLRYRQTYGYTDYVHPGRFAELQQRGILSRPIPGSVGYRAWASLSDSERQEVETWGPELHSELQGEPVMITAEIFEVLPAAAE